MRFERSVEVDAPSQRLWDVLTAFDAWPQVVETVEAVELLTPGPPSQGTRLRLQQEKLGEGTWEITSWNPPTSFELRQASPAGMTSVVDHRVEPLGDGRSRLTLSLDLQGALAPILGRLSKRMTERFLANEADSMKAAAEAAS